MSDKQYKSAPLDTITFDACGEANLITFHFIDESYKTHCFLSKNLLINPMCVFT
jgi:hypothetical protein